MQQRREGVTKKLARGRDVTGKEEIMVVVTLTVTRTFFGVS